MHTLLVYFVDMKYTHCLIAFDKFTCSTEISSDHLTYTMQQTGCPWSPNINPMVSLNHNCR